MSTEAGAWLARTNGSPLPKIVTRISPEANGSAPGSSSGVQGRPAFRPPGLSSAAHRCPLRQLSQLSQLIDFSSHRPALFAGHASEVVLAHLGATGWSCPRRQALSRPRR